MELFKKLKVFKNHTALISSATGSISYGNIINIINEIKKLIPKRSLIFLISDNNVASIISYIFSIKNNSIIMIVDIKTNNTEILELIKKYEPTYIFAPNFWFKISKNKNLQFLKKLYDYSILKFKQKKKIKFHNDLSVLLPTSGSLGSPKFVKLSKKKFKSKHKCNNKIFKDK